MVPAITADKLTKKFGDFTAVNQITFEVKKGEIFGFLYQRSRQDYGYAHAQWPVEAHRRAGIGGRV